MGPGTKLARGNALLHRGPPVPWSPGTMVPQCHALRCGERFFPDLSSRILLHGLAVDQHRHGFVVPDAYRHALAGTPHADVAGVDGALKDFLAVGRYQQPAWAGGLHREFDPAPGNGRSRRGGRGLRNLCLRWGCRRWCWSPCRMGRLTGGWRRLWHRLRKPVQLLAADDAENGDDQNDGATGPPPDPART